MTAEELRASGKETATVSEIGEILGMSAHSIRLQAREDASKLGFPVIVYGCQVRVPVRALLKFLDGTLGTAVAVDPEPEAPEEDEEDEA